MAKRQALRELQARLSDRLQIARTEGVAPSWLAVEAGADHEERAARTLGEQSRCGGRGRHGRRGQRDLEGRGSARSRACGVRDDNAVGSGVGDGDGSD